MYQISRRELSAFFLDHVSLIHLGLTSDLSVIWFGSRLEMSVAVRSSRFNQSISPGSITRWNFADESNIMVYTCCKCVCCNKHTVLVAIFLPSWALYIVHFSPFHPHIHLLRSVCWDCQRVCRGRGGFTANYFSQQFDLRRGCRASSPAGLWAGCSLFKVCSCLHGSSHCWRVIWLN